MPGTTIWTASPVAITSDVSVPNSSPGQRRSEPERDDGSCNFTCPAISRRYHLSAADRCTLFNPNSLFDWRGLLTVPAARTYILHGSSLKSAYFGRIELHR